MPRRKPQPRNTRRGASNANRDEAGFGDALTRRESGPGGYSDEDYVVRTIPGSRATKTYRCPGCDHDIRQGVPHLVTWPAEYGGADDRRHWHTGCWSGRSTRGLTRRWS
ncbi:ATP/GTP-binding protein [Rhodococcus sp. MSC1_016]|uniref:ATP/GTP-binding protein n=1 Tax=Rhodococcus sp. MSC1_016 TaxID=2909266 RepID=UPI002030BBEA|nr:ATP/GTP-binding protein [Rhodococcus sp. MSC1_016]